MDTFFKNRFLKNIPVYALVGIIGVFLLLCFYKLDSLPGEWFGDISIINNYVLAIVSGNHPIFFSTSMGPFYPYLISGFIKMLGISYFSYKIFSVLIGGIGLIFIFLFSKQIGGNKIALFTTFLVATSFWYIVWARLGNYNIITPGLTAMMMYCLLKYFKKVENKWLFFSIISSCFGLFTYAGVFLLPVVVLLLVLYHMVFVQKKIDKKKIFVLSLCYIPVLLLFLYILANPQNNFKNGYLGSKVVDTFSLGWDVFLRRLLTNIFRTITMFYLEGDIVFRWNISKMPLIDMLSAFFLVVGFVYGFMKQKKYFVYLCLPLFILPIPSIFPGHPPAEIPSSPRTMAILPFIYLFIAYGVEASRISIRRKLNKEISFAFCCIVFLVISVINIYNYFVRYPQGLPNHNIAYGKEIGTYINKLPIGRLVYLSSCCWGEWGQPELDSIYYAVKRKKYLNTTYITRCADITRSEFVIIFDPSDTDKSLAFSRCFPKSKLVSHIINKELVFVSLENSRK